MIDSAFVDNLQIHNTSQYLITKITGLGSPKARANRKDRAQRHGQLDYTQFYGPRVVGIEGLCVGTTVSNAWDLFDALKGAFALGTAHTFRFQRTGKTYQEQFGFTVDGEVDAPLEIAIGVIQWGATIVAADPRMYAAILSSAIYDPTLSTAGGGATMVGGMTVVGGLTFSTTTVTRLDLTNNGNFTTPAIVTVTGPVTNPIVDNDTLGLSMYILYTLGVNDTVVIDTGARTVLLNGASRPDIFDAQNSTWWQLQRGVNSLRLRGTGMVSGQTTLSAAFREARI